jgi:hypothetical protein
VNDETNTPPHAGCLASFVSISLAALLLTLGSFSPFRSLGLYVAILVVTAMTVLFIGMPLYLLVRYLRRENVWTAVIAGAVTGAALPMIAAFSYPMAEAWRTVTGFAVTGAVGGLAFFLTATASRNPARNIAILLAVAGCSVAGSALLSPTPSSTTR